MSHTFRLPPQRQKDILDPDDDSTFAPVPAAHRRAKTFLKAQLKAEMDAGWHPLINKLGRRAMIEELRAQLLAFSKKEYPFNQKIGEVSPLQWWKRFENNEHGRTLAVRKR
jgi:hypothetical protein